MRADDGRSPAMGGALPEGGPLPEWPASAPGLLIAEGPHAIPISTAVRAGVDRLVFALARRRTTLARLRDDPRAAFAVLAEGVAFTAYGEAVLVRDPLVCVSSVAALELRAERVQDHLADGRTEMLAAARWRWTSEDAGATDRVVLEEIEVLARR